MYKASLIILLLLIRITVNSQLSGHYNHRNEWTSESIIFKKGHQVEYIYRGETGDEQGIGKYKLKGDSLVLYFKKHPADTGNPNIQAQYQPHQAGECKLTMHIKEKKSQDGAPNAYVRILNKGIGTRQTRTDIDGKCELRIPATSDTLTLEVAYIGYTPVTHKFVARGNYNIVIEMDGWQTRHYKEGERLTFYLAEKPTVSDLYLTRSKGSQAVRFRKWGK